MSVYTVLDEDRRPIAFYREEIHGESIPEDAIEISASEWRELVDHPGCRRVGESGELVECEPPPPIVNDQEPEPKRGLLRWR